MYLNLCLPYIQKICILRFRNVENTSDSTLIFTISVRNSEVMFTVRLLIPASTCLKLSLITSRLSVTFALQLLSSSSFFAFSTKYSKVFGGCQVSVFKLIKNLHLLILDFQYNTTRILYQNMIPTSYFYQFSTLNQLRQVKTGSLSLYLLIIPPDVVSVHAHHRGFIFLRNIVCHIRNITVNHLFDDTQPVLQYLFIFPYICLPLFTKWLIFNFKSRFIVCNFPCI